MDASRPSQDSRWHWTDRRHDVEVAFFGRGREPDSNRDWLMEHVPSSHRLASLRQVHGAAVLDARAGCVGDGDALVTDRRDLVLTVVTADCVPVLMASGGQLAAVHAGWRGIVAEILSAAVRRLPCPEMSVAWIGPAIGPCCYEVGDDVADRVEAVSHASVVERRDPRPHVDLVAAAAWQLAAAGVKDIRRVPACTACETQTLWSYRRQGGAAGRNVAAIWRQDSS